MSIRQGENATIIRHDAVFGRREKIVRKFKVGEVVSYAQYKQAVSVQWVEPRKRNCWRFVVVPDNLVFCTIEHDGRVLYDSRNDVPCDMAKWSEVSHEWRHRRQEVA
jgi:hypothetical protein